MQETKSGSGLFSPDLHKTNHVGNCKISEVIWLMTSRGWPLQLDMDYDESSKPDFGFLGEAASNEHRLKASRPHVFADMPYILYASKHVRYKVRQPSNF